MPTAAVKAAKLAEIRAAILSGKDIDSACLAAKVSRGTYYRWAKAGAAGGLLGLKDGKPTGRPKALELTREETLGLRGHALLAGSMDGGVAEWLRESARPAAEREFPELCPASPATLAFLLDLQQAARKAGRRPSWPGAVRTAARTTTSEEAHLRGGKGLLSVTPSARRAMIWVDEGGTVHQVLPGTIWESDDMSENRPFRFHDADQGRETVGRQCLFTGDVFSHASLGVSLIGRKRQSYRVEDIAKHLRDIVSLYGLPLIWRFEKGVWDNEFIYGHKAPPAWGLPDDFRFGGLDGHLFRCCQKHTSRGKGGVENSFKAYQSFRRHHSTSIGAYRGEFARAAKLYRAALEGVAHAQRAFWAMGEAAEGIVQDVRSYNAKAQFRRAFAGRPVVPEELWSGHAARACPPSEWWRFLPVKHHITVRQGVVETRVDKYPLSFRFIVHGSAGMPCLDHGHRVFIAFDPAEPQLGCHLFNGETTTSPRNRDRIRLLEPLGIAEWWQDTPQENFAATAAAFDPQRRAGAALRAEFRAAFPGGAGALISRSDAKDIYGRLAADPIKAMTTPPPPGKTAATAPRRVSGGGLVDLYGSAAAAAANAG